VIGNPAYASPNRSTIWAHFVADHDDESICAGLTRLIEDVREQRPAGDIDEPFRPVGSQLAETRSTTGSGNHCVHTTMY